MPYEDPKSYTVTKTPKQTARHKTGLASFKAKPKKASSRPTIMAQLKMIGGLMNTHKGQLKSKR